MTALSDHTFVIVAVNAIGASTGFSANVTTVDATFTVDDTLPHGTVAIIYNQSLTINWNGFYGNQISTVTASGLPDGLTLDTVISEGLSFTVTGTPTTPGTYPVTITMTLTDGLQLTQQITIVVDEATVTPGAPSISVSSHDLAENGSVAWTLTGDATGYAICGFVNDIISGCIQANGFPATGSWVWSQLHPAYGNATFTLRLYLVSDITDPTALTIDTPYVSSDWFQIAPATPTAPAQVSDLTVVSTTTSSADLTWTPAVGAGQYTIYVNGTLVATVDGATASYTATGLTADTEYTFSIVASNENGDSAQADTTATTQADNTTTGGGGNGGGSNGSAPGAVTDLTHALVTTTTAHLNWTAVDGATSYKVYVNGTLVASVDGATTTYDLEALTAGTDYIISVEASNTYGDSAQADDTFTTTKTPVVIHVNGKTIKIGFSADSAKLSAATKKALKALVAFAHAKGLTTISVVGYTKKYDSKHETWRANLGKKRATAIATYLKTLDKNLNLTALGKGSVNKGRVAVVTIKGADITN
jgi:outer membrane protein OmpA-like peptidoglycan-associated protein